MDAYLLLKTAHILGVILFIGNIIVTAWWKAAADRTRDPRIISFAQRQVTLTDWVFTLGGVALVSMAGNGIARWHDIPLTTPWIALGYFLFAASGVIWIAILVPLQTALGRMAKEFAAMETVPQDYWRLQRRWVAFGILATIPPLAAIPVMVFKFG